MAAIKPAERKPLLYGPTGKPVSYGLYPSPRQNPRKYRPRPCLQRHTKQNVAPYDRSELVNLSRQLFAQLGNLGAAICDKNFWAFGDAWEPHYTGNNEAWGVLATRFLRDQFFPNCDRHGRHDWRTLLYLSGIAWDRDGDDVMLLTEDPNGSGFPKVEFIPATRVSNGDRVGAKSKVDRGPFEGLDICDGIITDTSGMPVGVRVLGLDEDGKETFTDFSLGFGGTADLAYQAEWTDQLRGIPLVARVVLDGMDLQDIDEFLKRGIKRAASVGLISKTAEAEAGVGNEILIQQEITDTAGNAGTITYEEVEGGEMYYLHKDGEAIEGLQYQNPHPNVEQYISRIERRTIKAVGWSYELIYLGESGRAASRLVCRLGNNSIWKQQKLGYRRTWRAVRYALAKAQKNNFLPRNPDGMDAYFAWEFGLPAGLSVDDGNDQAADRENLKIGTTNKALIAQKNGQYWNEIRRQRKSEIFAAIDDANDIVTRSAGKISFDRAMELVEQRTANGALASNPASSPQPAQASQPNDMGDMEDMTQ